MARIFDRSVYPRLYIQRYGEASVCKLGSFEVCVRVEGGHIEFSTSDKGQVLVAHINPQEDPRERARAFDGLLFDALEPKIHEQFFQLASTYIMGAGLEIQHGNVMTQPNPGNPQVKGRYHSGYLIKCSGDKRPTPAICLTTVWEDGQIVSRLHWHSTEDRFERDTMYMTHSEFSFRTIALWLNQVTWRQRELFDDLK